MGISLTGKNIMAFGTLAWVEGLQCGSPVGVVEGA